MMSNGLPSSTEIDGDDADRDDDASAADRDQQIRLGRRRRFLCRNY